MIFRVVVKKNGFYYQCPDKGKIKCGVCLWGVINPFGRKGIDDECKKCGARLSETVYGFNELVAKSYSP